MNSATVSFASLDKATIETITRFLDVDTEVESADVAFNFGGRFLEPVPILAELVYQARVKLVVLTGGVNRINGVNEAQMHLQALVQESVPRYKIVVEDTSTTTLENVVFALPLLASSVCLDDVRAIIVVSKWYHCRRAMMTLKRHLPNGIRYFAKSYELAGVARDDWHRDEAAAKRVLKEWHVIPQYLGLGHISEVARTEDGFM